MSLPGMSRVWSWFSSGTKPSTSTLSQTLSRSANSSTSSLSHTLSRSANSSVTTLALQEELFENPKAFTDKYLTKEGKKKELTNTAKDLLKVDFSSVAHVGQVEELGRKSRLVRAMNAFGGQGTNIAVIDRLAQLAERFSRAKTVTPPPQENIEAALPGLRGAFNTKPKAVVPSSSGK